MFFFSVRPGRLTATCCTTTFTLVTADPRSGRCNKPPFPDPLSRVPNAGQACRVTQPRESSPLRVICGGPPTQQAIEHRRPTCHSQLIGPWLVCTLARFSARACPSPPQESIVYPRRNATVLSSSVKASLLSARVCHTG